MKISFECDDPEVCKLILKALLEHIESKDLCKQLELSIEMAKQHKNATKQLHDAFNSIADQSWQNR